MNDIISLALKDWIPLRLSKEGDSVNCHWLYTGNQKFSDPFFDDTIAKCKNLSNNSRVLKSVSSIEILPEWAEHIKAIPPTAIIFHISRCGSTLISQLLGMQPVNIILSEVPFFDELLRRAHKENAMDAALPLLKAAIDLYSAKREKTDSHLFIKTDSWHIHFYAYFRKLYPHTPFILLYRKPDEVIRSHQKRRGMQAVPGLLEPEIFGFSKNRVLPSGLDEYMAAVLETYFEAFIKIIVVDDLALAVNYIEGPLAMIKRIGIFAGITITEKESAAMLQRAAFHGKYPGQVFTEVISKEKRPDYLSKCFSLYDEIEKIRIAGLS